MTRGSLVALAALALAWPTEARSQVEDGSIGSRCDSDGACVPGLLCLGADGPYGGPAGGLCTLFCAADEECMPYGESASCGGGLCLEGCRLGADVSESERLPKCHGRDDMACAAGGVVDGDVLGACAPLCATDDQCGKGLFCSLATGFCQPYPAEGDPPGTACDYYGANTCSGFCDIEGLSEDLISFTGICQEPCVIGTPVGCSTPVAGGQPRACLGELAALLFTAPAAGDLGACVTLCDCTSDCADNEVCAPYDLGESYDFAGLCLRGPRPPGDADCLSGDTGGAGAAGDTSSPACEYGTLRACNVTDCLGIARCLSDGSYGQCECTEDATGTAGVGGAPAGPTRPKVSDAGCGCRKAGPARGSSTLLALLTALLLARSGRRRTRAVGSGKSKDHGPVQTRPDRAP